jgi:hypothetical protein
VLQILKNTTNVFGPVEPETQKRITAYMAKPSAKLWDDIHSIIIHWPGKPNTIWQAVVAIDPTFPKSGQPVPYGIIRRPEHVWRRWPDAFTLARAIKAALASEED